VFDKDLSADPVDWVAAKLANLEELLDEAGAGGDPADPGDAADLRACLHEIVEIVTRLLDRVRGGLAGRPPGSDSLTSVRAGWL